jgi:hypothetical protein
VSVERAAPAAWHAEARGSPTRGGVRGPRGGQQTAPAHGAAGSARGEVPGHSRPPAARAAGPRWPACVGRSPGPRPPVDRAPGPREARPPRADGASSGRPRPQRPQADGLERGAGGPGAACAATRPARDADGAHGWPWAHDAGRPGRAGADAGPAGRHAARAPTRPAQRHRACGLHTRMAWKGDGADAGSGRGAGLAPP